MTATGSGAELEELDESSGSSSLPQAASGKASRAAAAMPAARRFGVVRMGFS